MAVRHGTRGVIGVGVETPLADTWALRLEGLYLDFDGKTHFVNSSGDNRCGPRRNRRGLHTKVARWVVVG